MQDADGDTPLHVAVSWGNLDFCKVASLDPPTHERAVDSVNVAPVQMLSNRRGSWYWSGHVAVSWGDLDFCKVASLPRTNKQLLYA